MLKFFGIFQLGALAAFLASFVGRTIAMRLRERINPIVLGAGKSGPRRVLELLVPAALVFWVAEIVNHALGPSPWWLPAGAYEPLFDSLPAKLLGAAMTVFGLALFGAALRAFGASWRVGVDVVAPGSLVMGGVFAISRNPIFVFMDLYALGGFLINGTPVFLAIAAVMIVVAHFQILQEERFLASHYGSSYENYRAHTDRYLTLSRGMKA